MAKKYCTMWPDGMFGVYWGDLCYDHDAAYSEGSFWKKIVGDFVLAAGIAGRSLRAEKIWQKVIVALSSIVVLLGTLTGGTIKWWWDHWSDNLR